MKSKQPHKLSEATTINCEFCRGLGKAPGLGLDSGVIDLCHHCNGLGLIDEEKGSYHVDIVIQKFQSIIKNQKESIAYLRGQIKAQDPRCGDFGVGQFGAKRSD